MTLLVSDRDLLDAFRRGEDRAIERVYRAYVDQVTAMLRRGFSFSSSGRVIRFRGYTDTWELESAVQDTFIQAFSPRARQSYDGIKPYGPYLMTIAKNRVISLLRSDWRERRRRAGLAAEGKPPGPDSPESAAIKKQVKDIVKEFRGSIAEDLREYLDARYGADRTLMGAARELGLTRMKARLREQKLQKAFVSYLRERGVLRSAGGTIAGLPDLMVLLTLGGI